MYKVKREKYRFSSQKFQISFIYCLLIFVLITAYRHKSSPLR